MSEEIQDNNIDNIKNDLQYFFNKMIGAKVDFIDKQIENDEDLFEELIGSLEESIKAQELVLIHGGIDVEKIVGPLWWPLECYMSMVYGEEAFDMIMWYLFGRWNEDGSIKNWVDIDGKEYPIGDKRELWKFIHYNFLS